MNLPDAARPYPIGAHASAAALGLCGMASFSTLLARTATPAGVLPDCGRAECLLEAQRTRARGDKGMRNGSQNRIAASPPFAAG